MLLLLLSRFSRVRLCATPQTAACKVLLFLGFSRQEYRSRLPFPSPMHTCMLSCFSCVQLCATPWTAAHQEPPSLGFSRQEHWSGLPFLSPMHERKSESEVAQLCPTLSNPMDCSLPGSSIHGIFQGRVLEWVAIAFSLYCTEIVLNIPMCFS